MSFDKAIEHKKEKRKPFKGSKRFDSHCLNHGQCSYCSNGRQFFDKKRRYAADEQLKEYLTFGGTEDV